jgi:AraC-like DNA-binding protein
MNTRLNHIKTWLPLAKQAGWSVTTLAKICGVSVRALERHFQRTEGKTPKAWLVEQRQKQAVELLRSGFSVKETSGGVGYRHPTTFAREFKKISGQCPTALTLAFEHDATDKCRKKL